MTTELAIITTEPNTELPDIIELLILGYPIDIAAPF